MHVRLGWSYSTELSHGRYRTLRTWATQLNLAISKCGRIGRCPGGRRRGRQRGRAFGGFLGLMWKWSSGLVPGGGALGAGGGVEDLAVTWMREKPASLPSKLLAAKSEVGDGDSALCETQHKRRSATGTQRSCQDPSTGPAPQPLLKVVNSVILLDSAKRGPVKISLG